MNWMNSQTAIDISGTEFSRFQDQYGNKGERFWYVKEEFIRHSQSLLSEGQIFNNIGGRLLGKKWICEGKAVSKTQIAEFVWKLRLFYLKSENMSIFSLCSYMETNVKNSEVIKFFAHMRESWEECLDREVSLFGKYYSGQIKTNKQLIDTLLYSGNFHSQEKYKRRYDELLEYFDESLILKFAYNAMHSGYQMTQISRAIKDLREDNLVISLPNHLRHKWRVSRP